jgi:hypothetical protein
LKWLFSFASLADGGWTAAGRTDVPSKERIVVFSETSFILESLSDGLRLRVDQSKLPFVCWYFTSNLRRKEWIQHKIEHLIDHEWEQPTDVIVRCSQIGVVIDLQQPSSEILVNQEIVAEQFEFLLTLCPMKMLLE